MLSLLADFRGELAALMAALIWAVASVIYTGVGRHLSPLFLNLAKGVVAIALILVILLLQGKLFPTVNDRAIALLSLSGVIGIGIGDTAYFESLNCIGARRSLAIESLAPPLAALLALIFLQEYLDIAAWFGIALTIAGVIWVVLERVPDATCSQLRPLRGIGSSLLAALCQASGAVLSRAALAGTDIDPLWSTLARLLGGTSVLLIWIAIQRRSLKELKPLRSRKLLTTLIGTAFASTFLAIWLQQISLKHAAAGVSQALSATSPLFVIPIAIAIGEKVSMRAIVGVIVALSGIWLLFSP
ncbi:DMT family transporter [Leptothermofonsia sp. ETS-13]|uniref:DMT family transporter n=1 Tax=Leptothermofonsia sp. ETS-13 TaxID=3035696 RepID=UPI003BA190C7